jgi:hypothetical protein
MKFRKERDLAYLAGALDERMKFHVLKTGNFQMRLRTKGNLPKLLKKEFGGSWYSNGDPERLSYRIQGRKAVRLLEAVLPYLKTEAKTARRILTSWKERQQRSK